MIEKNTRSRLIQTLMLTILISVNSFSDANSEAFSRLVKESATGGGDIIVKSVNALYYGLMTMYRGVSTKISQLCGIILLGFMIVSILKIILQNIDKLEIYGIMKLIIPVFVKNLVIAFILIVPVNYKGSLAFGGGGGLVSGTLMTQMVELFFSMFYRLGLIFFNDVRFNNISPGELASLFFLTPMKLLGKAFGFMSFFALFINLAKVFILLLCLWLTSGIVAIYISNIFMALMLSMFSILYMIFLTLEGTEQIGRKGINTIIVQSVTLFMTVAMMGVSYQVLKLLAIGDSLEGAITLGIMLFVLRQVMGNVGVMAVSLTSGSGVGASSNSFMGLAKALGTLAGGLALFTGSQIDELAQGKGSKNSFDGNEVLNNGKKENKEKLSKSEIESRASKLVRNAAGNEEVGRNRSWDSDNRIRAETNERRSGVGGETAGRVLNLLLQGATSDLSDINELKKLKSNIEDFNGKGKGNIPYNVYSNPREEAIKIMEKGWNKFKEELGRLELSPEGASMNQGVRGIAYNNDDAFKDKNRNNLENKVPLTNDYLNQNRNSLDKISQKYTNTEYANEMINSKIQSYRVE